MRKHFASYKSFVLILARNIVSIENQVDAITPTVLEIYAMKQR